MFNDHWMSRYGFLGADGEPTVGDVLRSKGGDLPALVHTHPSETVRDGDRHPARVRRLADAGGQGRAAGDAGEVGGSVSERDLLERCSPAGAPGRTRSSSTWRPALPLVGSGEQVASRGHALEGGDAVVVADEGKPVGVLTRADLLGFLSD